MKKTIVIGLMIVLLGVAAMPGINAHVLPLNKHVTEGENDDRGMLSYGGSPDIEWSKIYDTDSADYIRDIKQTRDGGYILVGDQLQSSGFVEGWLLKIDAVGNVEWDKNFNMGQSGIWLLGCKFKKEVIEVSDGYVAAGTAQQSDGGDPNIPYDCILLIKVDLMGNRVWEQKFGNSSAEAKLYSLHATNDGGFVLFGATGSNEFIVLKTDDAGNTLWKKTYKEHEIFHQSVYFNGIKTTRDNGFIINGHSMDASATCVLKLTASGDIEWYHSYYHYNDKVLREDIIQTADGGYLCCIGAGSILKTDSAGNEIWRKTYDGDEIRSLAEVRGDGYIFTGKYYGWRSQRPDFWVMRVDSNGNELWSRTFGVYEDRDEGICVRQTNDDGFIVLGQIDSKGDSCDPNAWLIKFEADSSSSLKPSRPYGPSSGEPGMEYEFSTSMQHPDGLDVQFGWDWNGDHVVDEWTDDWYGSGESCVCVHTWEDKGVYQVCVKAKDTTGMESRWSDPLSVSMPKARVWSMSVFQLFDDYPFVQQLLFRLLRQ